MAFLKKIVLADYREAKAAAENPRDPPLRARERRGSDGAHADA